MLEFQQSQQLATQRIWFFQLTNLAPASEVPSGLKNNSNVTFTVLNVPQYLTLNGQTLVAGTEYTISGLTITMTTAPISSDVLLSWYANAPLTGQTGHGYLSVNGAAGVQSSNTFTEIDSVNMPGSYYLQLTQGEIGTLGTLNLYVKTTLSNAYNGAAIVTYNNPFASQGGFVAPSDSTTGGFTKAMSEDLLEKIKKMIVAEFDKREKEEDEEEQQQEQTDYTEILNQILQAVTVEPEEEEVEPIDFSPVLEAIAAKENPKDYSNNFSAIEKAIAAMSPVMTEFGNAVKTFESKMGAASGEINSAMEGISKLTKGFSDLEVMMEKFKEAFDSQVDMDKRFAAINGKMKDEKLQEISDKFLELQKMMINHKYDILKALIKPAK